MKIRESYGSRRYEEEYRAALEKSVHYFRQNSCITELRKMGYAQTKLQVEYEAEEYGKSEICCLDAETNTFFNSESAEKFIAENDLSKCENVNIYGDIRQIYCFGYDDKKVVYALTEMVCRTTSRFPIFREKTGNFVQIFLLTGSGSVNLAKKHQIWIVH